MAYTVNWMSKVIFIPVTDMELVSGTYYKLNMTSFWQAIRQLEADPAQGLWAPQVLQHSNTRTLAGVTYVAENQVINGYTVEFDPTASRVDLYGDNNNIVDVLVVNGVSVVPSNSAGNTVTVGGSALTTAQNTMLVDTLPTLLGAVDTKVDIVDNIVDLIKSKSDQLTFTKVGEVDANVKSQNGAAVYGNGTAGNLWRGTP